ncbi:MAG TPA: hypothetical protein VMD99_12175 [Terriglobales bacterium]|nr:hypothetical protein [Terriglobales bacterium]
MKRHIVIAVAALWSASFLASAQQTTTTTTTTTTPDASEAASPVPRLVQFSGFAKDLNGAPLSGVVGITFALYAQQNGGEPLWLETQNVQADARGHYSAQLGVTNSNGLPTDLFTSGEARWLGVQISGQDEQPRVLLLSVPYALKAGDAQTLGGLPPSAFVLAAPPNGDLSVPAVEQSTLGQTATASATAPPPTSSDVTTTGGTVGTIAAFSTSTNIQSSLLSQTGKTTINVAGQLNLPATGAATSSAGFDSRPQTFVASAYNSTSSAAVPQTFQWQAEPSGNDTASASGTFNLLFGQGTTKPAETGLNIASDGLITFAAGQTFPGTGDGTITGVTTASGSGLSGGGTSGTLNLGLTTACAANQVLQWSGSTWACSSVGAGTITGVTAGTDLSGGGTSGNVTLNLNTTALNSAYAQLSANNTFAGAQTINNSVTVTGSSASNELQVTNTSSSAAAGILGTVSSTNGYGMEGVSPNVGVFGSGTGTGGIGLDGHGTLQGAKGVATATSGLVEGVYGQTSSDSGYGVEGVSPYIGVYGASDGASGETPSGVGVWGDTGGPAEGGYVGVYGSAGANYAGAFVNNSVDSPTLTVENITANSGAYLFFAASGTGGECLIDVNADLTCSGSITGVANVDGGTRKVALYSTQSTESWYEDAGSGQLNHGAAIISLDSTFAQTVNTGVEYHVFLTPKGDCEGLYVANETAQGFEVHELRGGHSSIAFDYRIMAKRVGYENVRMKDVTASYQELQKHEQLLRRPRHVAATAPLAATSARQ